MPSSEKPNAAQLSSDAAGSSYMSVPSMPRNTRAQLSPGGGAPAGEPTIRSSKPSSSTSPAPATAEPNRSASPVVVSRQIRLPSAPDSTRA